MFRKPIREKLKTEGWTAVIKKGGNASQSKNRTNELVLIALSDIVLLYNKLPREDRDELFSLRNLRNIFDTILSVDFADNITNLEIATYLMKKSMEIFKEKFNEVNKDTTTIANLISDPLDKALNICEEITYKEKLNSNKFEVTNENIRYLCSWDKILTRDRLRFKDYIKSGMKFIVRKFEIQRNQHNVNQIIGSFEDNLGKKFSFSLILYEVDKYASLKIQAIDFNTQRDFSIKSSDGEYLLYDRDDS
jgi:hypothetical protein